MNFGIFGIPVRHSVCQGPGAVGLVRALWLLRERERAREGERQRERERERERTLRVWSAGQLCDRGASGVSCVTGVFRPLGHRGPFDLKAPVGRTWAGLISKMPTLYFEV